jgi:hypothetical protein
MQLLSYMHFLERMVRSGEYGNYPKYSSKRLPGGILRQAYTNMVKQYYIVYDHLKNDKDVLEHPKIFTTVANYAIQEAKATLENPERSILSALEAVIQFKADLYNCPFDNTWLIGYMLAGAIIGAVTGLIIGSFFGGVGSLMLGAIFGGVVGTVLGALIYSGSYQFQVSEKLTQFDREHETLAGIINKFCDSHLEGKSWITFFSKGKTIPNPEKTASDNMLASTIDVIRV